METLQFIQNEVSRLRDSQYCDENDLLNIKNQKKQASRILHNGKFGKKSIFVHNICDIINIRRQ